MQNQNTTISLEATSWIEVPTNNDFPLQNIPFGIFSTEHKSARLATRIGDTVIDLYYLAARGFFKEFNISTNIFEQNYINDFMALGKKTTNAVRLKIASIFQKENVDNKRLLSEALHSIQDVKLHLPVKIGDYTDFYSSRQHAYNVGVMFRDPANALLPNWLHLPVGYHGRSSSIVVSGTEIRRPKGQTMPKDATQPVFGPSRLLDFELEVAFVVGKNSELGSSITTEEAEDYIFGLCLFNDWSARDIQKWEYVPLGPFLAKNFASSISPWIVTLEALEPFRIQSVSQEPEVFPYLKSSGNKRFDIQLEVLLQPENGRENTICTSNFKNMYWNMSQQLAHHTVNGCNVNVGDMCASGTISGDSPNAYGSMLELSWQGTKSIQLSDGTERKFIQDGDTVIIRGHGKKGDLRIGFGEVSGKILPAL